MEERAESTENMHNSSHFALKKYTPQYKMLISGYKFNEEPKNANVCSYLYIHVVRLRDKLPIYTYIYVSFNFEMGCLSTCIYTCHSTSKWVVYLHVYIHVTRLNLFRDSVIHIYTCNWFSSFAFVILSDKQKLLRNVRNGFYTEGSLVIRLRFYKNKHPC
jgi:hypothetical protein